MEIIYTAVAVEPDRRYRVLVSLARSDRPSHYKFHCPKCTMPVAEFVNMDIKAMTDMIDYDNANNHLLGVRCDGRFEGGRCNIWYFYSLEGTAISG